MSACCSRETHTNKRLQHTATQPQHNCNTITTHCNIRLSPAALSMPRPRTCPPLLCLLAVRARHTQISHCKTLQHNRNTTATQLQHTLQQEAFAMSACCSRETHTNKPLQQTATQPQHNCNTITTHCNTRCNRRPSQCPLAVRARHQRST